MESCSSDIAVVEPSATFSLVLFHDIPHAYPPSTQVTCQYTLTAGFQPNTRDWVGVFKVGWSSTKDYHTFVWVEPCFDVVSEDPVKKQVVFNDYYLPKDDAEFYQFCYVDSSGQVRGASTPFCFKSPEEPSVDYSLEADLLVITTQEQVEQSARERDELQKEMDQMRVQNESIKSALMEKQREVDHLKEGSERERKELAKEFSQMKEQNESLIQEQVEQSARERDELQKEMDQMRVQDESIKSALMEKQREVDHLKEGSEQERKELAKEFSQMKEQNESLRSSLREQQQELDCVKGDLIQKAHQLEQQNSRVEEKLSQSLKSVDSQIHSGFTVDESQREQGVKQKYDRAVVKINQLKQEQEELYGTLSIQSVEIAELKPKLREQEQKVLKLRDDIQLLQVDLQSSEKDKERLHVELRRLDELTLNLDELKRENEELRRCRQEMLQNIPDEDMKVQYQTLLNQLQDTRSQLSNERHSFQSTQRRSEQLQRDLADTKEQLEGLASSSDQMKRCSSKVELQLTEAHGIIAEKSERATEMDNMIMIEKQENEQLERQNQILKRDIERLHTELAEQMASTAESIYMQPSSPHGFSPETITTSSQGQQEDTLPESLQYDPTLYESIGTSADTEEEESFVCQHCQEAFPGLTREERVLHEQSHQVCPFCTLICDGMEQSLFENHVYSHEL